MKKSLAVLAVLVLLCSSAFGERFGKPGASLAKGQWSLGLEYNYIETEVDLQTPQNWVVAQLGEEQAVLNQVLVVAGYGLTDSLQAILKIGGTSVVVQDAFFDDFGNRNENFDGDMEFTIAGGLAYTILKDGNFTLGVNGALSWFQTNDDNGEVRFLAHEAAHADVLTLEGALMASYQMGKITPYGGVCMHIADADAYYRWLLPGPILPVMVDIDVDQEDWFGLVLGANCQITDSITVGIEMTHVSEGVGVSLGVNAAL